MKRLVLTALMVVLAGLLSSTSLRAQGAVPIPPATPGCPHNDDKVAVCYDLQLYYGAIKNNLNVLAAAIPADKFFTPPPGIANPRGEGANLGAEFAHAAEIASRMCILMNYKNPNWEWEAQWEKDTNKVQAVNLKTRAEVLAGLKKSFDQCDPHFFNVTEARLSETVTGNHGPKPLATTLFNVVSHSREVYGRTVTMMALFGIQAAGETQALTPKQKRIEDAAAAAAAARRPAGGAQ